MAPDCPCYTFRYCCYYVLLLSRWRCSGAATSAFCSFHFCRCSNLIFTLKPTNYWGRLYPLDFRLIQFSVRSRQPGTAVCAGFWLSPSFWKWRARWPYRAGVGQTSAISTKRSFTSPNWTCAARATCQSPPARTLQDPTQPKWPAP